MQQMTNDSKQLRVTSSKKLKARMNKIDKIRVMENAKWFRPNLWVTLNRWVSKSLLLEFDGLGGEESKYVGLWENTRGGEKSTETLEIGGCSCCWCWREIEEEEGEVEEEEEWLVLWVLGFAERATSTLSSSWKTSSSHSSSKISSLFIIVVFSDVLRRYVACVLRVFSVAFLILFQFLNYFFVAFNLNWFIVWN